MGRSTQSSPPTPRTARLAAAAIGATVILQLGLACVVLEPRTFFSGDAGVKYLQAHALVASGWRSLAVISPGDRVDPAGRFSMMNGAQFARVSPDAPFYGAYSVLFTGPVSLPLAWFGARGLYLVPILATAVTMLLTYRLAARCAGRVAWLAPLLVGACSPMLFYSVDLWEHTLSVLCTTAAVWLAVGAAATGAPRRFALAGVSLGLAIAIREEIIALVPAALVVLATVPRPRRLRAGAAAAAGLCISLLPHQWLQWSQSGLPARTSVLRVLGLLPPRSDPGTASLAATDMLVPTESVALLGLVVLVGLRLAAPRAGPAWRGPAFYGLGAAIAAWAAADAFVVAHYWWRPTPLVCAFPVMLALLLLPPRASGDAAAREVRRLLVIAALFAVAVSVAARLGTNTLGGAQWGPRFLMPVYPLLATAIAAACTRWRDWSPLPHPQRVVVATVSVLVLASFVVQMQGVRDLHRSKLQYDRLVRALEAVEGPEVIVTDVPWLGPIAAAVSSRRPLLYVDSERRGMLAELLAALDGLGTRHLTFVGATASAGRVRDQIVAEGWQPGAVVVVPLWMELGITRYSM